MRMLFIAILCKRGEEGCVPSDWPVDAHEQPGADNFGLYSALYIYHSRSFSPSLISPLLSRQFLCLSRLYTPYLGRSFTPFLSVPMPKMIAPLLGLLSAPVSFAAAQSAGSFSDSGNTLVSAMMVCVDVS
jgi:hypothetical protein